MEKAGTRYDFFPILKFYVLLGLLLLSLVFVIYIGWYLMVYPLKLPGQCW